MLEEEKDWFKRYTKLTPLERRKLDKDFNPMTFRKKPNNNFDEESLKKLKELVVKKRLILKKTYDEYRRNFNVHLPCSSAIVKHFGSWKNFQNETFTEEEIIKNNQSRHIKQPSSRSTRYDDDKLFATIQFLNLKTHKDFLEARKAFPDIVPCQKTIYNHFGGYKRLRKLVLTRNLKSIIERYVLLCYNFNIKKLRPYNCRRNGIDIDWAIEQVGSRKKFYELVDFAKENFNFLKSIVDQKKKEKENKKNENQGTNKTKN